MQHTHSLLAQTAREIAAEFYEEAARIDGFYALHKSQRQFVKRHWKHFVSQAYDSLVQVLGQSDDRVHPSLKEKVYEAILAHRTLNPDNDPGATGQIIH